MKILHLLLSLWVPLTAGAALGATYTWNGGSGDWATASNWTPVTGPPGAGDTAVLSGGSVTISTDTTIDTLDLSGGSIYGSAVLTVRNTMHWTAGGMQGSGRTVIAEGATLYLANSTGVGLNTWTLENAGMVLWTGPADLGCSYSAVITNRPGALWEVRNDQTISQAPKDFSVSRFDNAGTFLKRVGTGTTTFGSGAGLAFNNYGTVELESGTLFFYSLFNHFGTPLEISGGSVLQLGRGGVASGAFANQTGGRVEWLGGTYTLTAGAALAGPGVYTSESSATVAVDTDVAVQNFDLAATLSGTNTLTVSNAMHWTAGTMSGSGRTVIAEGATLFLDNSTGVSLSTRTLENLGMVVWTGTADLGLVYGAVVTNRSGALWEVRNDQQIIHGWNPISRFDNAGTFRKRVGTGTTAFTIAPSGASGIWFNNYGTVELESGTLYFYSRFNHFGTPLDIPAGSVLQLGGGGVASGAFANQTGGRVEWLSGTYTLTAGAALAGPGVYTNASSATVAADTDVVVQNFDSAGTVGGTKTLTVSNAMHWTAGSMSGSGRTVIAEGATLFLNNSTDVGLSTRTLENGGMVVWTGTADLGLIYGAVVTNRPGALWEVRNDQQIIHGWNPISCFDNAGTFRKRVGTNTTAFTVAPSGASGIWFNNYGTVELESGTLYFYAPYTQFDGLTRLCHGSISNSAPLRLLGGVLTGSGTISGGIHNVGAVTKPGCSPGVLTVLGNYDQGLGGTLQIEIGGTGPGLTFDRLLVGGAATLEGTLSVTLVEPYYPPPNATFSFLTAGSRDGTFSTFDFPSNAIGMQVVYTTNEVSIEVINVRPVIPTIGAQDFDEVAPFSLAVGATDADTPAQTLTYALPLAPAGATINASGLISWTPTEEQGPMTTNITVQVTDNGTPNLSVSNTFPIVVNEINLPPDLALPPNQALPEETTFSSLATATDPDIPTNEPLVFELISGPAGLTVSPNGAIAWQTTEADGPDSYTVTVRVTDTNEFAVNEKVLSTTASFTLTVQEVNLPPSLTVPADQTLTEETLLSVLASAADPDLPPNALSFSLLSAPAGMTMDPVSGAIDWTPTEAQGSNSYTATVVVTDTSPLAINPQHLSDTNDFEITVNEYNRPPVLPSQPPQTLDELTLLTLDNQAADADDPANPLTYELIDPPPGASIGTDGVITWMPTESQGPGVYTVVTRVTDTNSAAINAGSLSETNEVVVTVREVNRPPVLPAQMDRTIDELTLLTVDNHAADADLPANTLTYELIDPPVGASIDASGLITWAPSPPQCDTPYTIATVVNDNSVPPLTDTNSFTVTVRDATPPVIACPSNRVVECTSSSGTFVTWTASADDACDGPVAVSCIPASGSLFALGDTTVNCSTADSHGNSNTCAFTVTVVDTTPPTLACPESVTQTATSRSGAVVDFVVTAVDACDPAPSLTCSPASGSRFPVGTTIVTCTAEDASGNTSMCTFPVYVREIVAKHSPGHVEVTWEVPGVVVEEADKPRGPWITVPEARSPLSVPVAEPAKFYRLRYIDGPRVFKVEPSIVLANDAVGTEVHLFGLNVESNRFVRVNGSLLTDQAQVETDVLRCRVTSLPVGTYDVELVDGLGTVLAVLPGGLEAALVPALRTELPPSVPGAMGGSAGDTGSVQLGNGEYQLTVEDLCIPGRGLDFVWQRTYRSRLGPNTPQGNGWDFDYNIYVEERGPNLVLHDGRGRADVYRPQSDGTYACAGFARVLVREPDGTVKLFQNAPTRGNSLLRPDCSNAAAHFQNAPTRGDSLLDQDAHIWDGNDDFQFFGAFQNAPARGESFTGGDPEELQDRRGQVDFARMGRFLNWDMNNDGAYDISLSPQFGASFLNGTNNELNTLVSPSPKTGGVLSKIVGNPLDNLVSPSPKLGGSLTRYVNQDLPIMSLPSPESGGERIRLTQTLVAQFHPLDSSPAAGKLERINDPNGNRIEFSYDTAGRLSSITDTLDRQITVAYNPEGQIESVTDFTGRQVQYAYYAASETGGSPGDLKSVTSPIVAGTPNDNNFPQGKTVTYTYTTGHADERLNHNLLTITDAKGQIVLSNTYAATTDSTDVEFDRVIRQSTPQSSNPAQQDYIDIHYAPQTAAPANAFATLKTIVNDPMGNVREHVFDSRNRLIRHRAYTGRADPTQPTTDMANRPTGKLRPTDPDYFETRYAWNPDSLLTQVLTPNSNRVDFVYEREVDPDTQQLRRQNLRLIRHLPGPQGGDQAELVQRFDYAPVVELSATPALRADRLTRYVNPRGIGTRHSYDARGNRIHTENASVPQCEWDFDYDGFGQVTAMVHPADGNGHRRRDQLDYNESGAARGYLRQITVDVGGQAVSWVYSANAVGLVEGIVNPGGHETRYTYNALNQLVRVQSPEVQPGIRYERLFWYDAKNNLVRMDIENRNETGALQPNTHFTRLYEYDGLNGLTRVVAEKGAANLPNTALSLAEIPLGERDQFLVEEFAYDANRNITLVRDGEAVNGNQPDSVVQVLHDERNLPFRAIRAPSSPDQSTCQWDFDGDGLVLRSTRGLEDAMNPRVWTRSYDGYNRCTSMKDPMGNVFSRHFDAAGNVTVQQLDGELTDMDGSAANVRLAQVSYQYDGLDRLIRRDVAHFDSTTQTPVGDGSATTLWAYAPNGQILSLSEDDWTPICFAYDTAGRLSRVTDARGNLVAYTRDAAGNVVTVEESDKSDLGHADQTFTTQFTYDALDRLTQVTDNVGNSNRFAYDARGNLVLHCDGASKEDAYIYDGVKRLTRTVRDMNGDGPDLEALPGDVNPDIVTGQIWDDSSRLIGQTDDNGNTTSYGYDGLDRRIATTYADCTAAATIYDVHGNGISHADANGTVVSNRFDLNNRLISRLVSPGPGVSSQTVSETVVYDGRGLVVLAENDDSTAVMLWDSMDNCTSETLNGHTTTRIFDGRRNLLSIHYPGGRQIDRQIDALGRVSAIYDGGTPLAHYYYVGPRRLERRDLANGTRLDVTHDGITGVPNAVGDYGVKQVVRTRHTRIATGAVLDDRTYRYDQNQNKTQQRDIRQDGPRYEHNYGYDAANRLVRTVVRDAARAVVRDEQYILDGVGNRISVAGGYTPGTYTMLGQNCTAPADFDVNQYTATPFDTRSYDQNGNLTVIDSGLATQRDFAYDYRNRLVEHIDAATGIISQYRYDVLGRRVARVVDVAGSSQETTLYFHNGRLVCEERDGHDVVQATYVRGIIGEEANDIISVLRGGQDYFYHCNDRSTVMALTDASASVIERYDYGDHGLVLDPDTLMPLSGVPSAIGNPCLFGGGRYDAETGSYLNGERHFDPLAGRFMQRGVAGLDDLEAAIKNSLDISHYIRYLR